MFILGISIRTMEAACHVRCGFIESVRSVIIMGLGQMGRGCIIGIMPSEVLTLYHYLNHTTIR